MLTNCEYKNRKKVKPNKNVKTDKSGTDYVVEDEFRANA
jgi:hypothetical protein